MLSRSEGISESGRALHSQSTQPPPSTLAHTVLTGRDDLLDLSDHDDSGQHVLHLLAGEGLRRVPHGAVWCHHRLWSHVVGVVAAFDTLRTEKQKQSPTEVQVQNPVRLFVFSSCSPFEEVKVIKFYGTAKRILSVLHLLFVHLVGS